MVEFDYEDKSTYAAVLRGVTSVFIVTSYTVDMLVHGKLFVDACKDAGVKYVVVSSHTASALTFTERNADVAVAPRAVFVHCVCVWCARLHSTWAWTCPPTSR